VAHDTIAEFQELFLAFVSSVPCRSELSEDLSELSRDLSSLLSALKPDLDVRATAVLHNGWDEWCEKFGQRLAQINDPQFDENLRHPFIVLPRF